MVPTQESPPDHDLRPRPKGTGQRHKIRLRGDSWDSKVCSFRILEERGGENMGESSVSCVEYSVEDVVFVVDDFFVEDGVVVVANVLAKSLLVNDGLARDFNAQNV